MNLTTEFQHIRDWAEARGIYEKGDPKTQMIKLVEEVGELGKAIIEQKPEEISDGLGDCVVVLVSIAKLCGLQLEGCVNVAFNEIKNRKGKVENGTFIKYTNENKENDANY